MGQKVNPIGFRLGINRTADSRWYADSADFGRLLHEDLAIRKAIRAKLKQAGISKIIIERPHKKCLITIHTARPGLVIGKKGGDIEVLRKELAKMTTDEVRVNLVEIRKPEIDATLIADDIARQLERRASFRRTMKRSIQSAMRLGAQGIRIMVAGRLGGAEIARTEQYAEGLRVGGMLGYVMDGDVPFARACVNAAITAHGPLQLLAGPAPLPPVGAVERFSTLHDRAPSENIGLRHALLSR